jgi:hypothetical protein
MSGKPRDRAHFRLFGPLYLNVILVPLTEDGGMVITELPVRIEPTPANGCAKTCFAGSPLVVGTSKARIRPTPSRISDAQRLRIRQQVAEAIGLR